MRIGTEPHFAILKRLRTTLMYSVWESHNLRSDRTREICRFKQCSASPRSFISNILVGSASIQLIAIKSFPAGADVLHIEQWSRHLHYYALLDIIGLLDYHGIPYFQQWIYLQIQSPRRLFLSIQDFKKETGSRLHVYSIASFCTSMYTYSSTSPCKNDVTSSIRGSSNFRWVTMARSGQIEVTFTTKAHVFI